MILKAEIERIVFLFIMMFVQLVAITINPSSWVTLVGGLSGTICVNLIAQGKASNYIFGFVRVLIIEYFGFKTRIYVAVLYCDGCYRAVYLFKSQRRWIW